MKDMTKRTMQPTDHADPKEMARLHTEMSSALAGRDSQRRHQDAQHNPSRAHGRRGQRKG